jgi:U3 small nucleolar RNA-associated protein 7
MKRRSAQEPETEVVVRSSNAYRGTKKNIKLRKTIEATLLDQEDAIRSNEMAKILLPETYGHIDVDSSSASDRTYRLKQKDMVVQSMVDMNTQKNYFDFQLRFGSYKSNYSRNGRYLLFGGKKGHVAIYDNLRTSVEMELQLQEDVNDVHYLHNESLFAVAQKKYVYMYDNKGTEIHCMRQHEAPYTLDYLPYHYLLNSIGHSGWIKWHDISIGAYVAGFATGLGPSRVLKHNPSNAVAHVGHSNGVVTLWSPTSSKALASILCHRSPITDLAIDREGRYLATAGLDGLLKVLDSSSLTLASLP